MHAYVINPVTFYQMWTRILWNFNIQHGRIPKYSRYCLTRPKICKYWKTAKNDIAQENLSCILWSADSFDFPKMIIITWDVKNIVIYTTDVRYKIGVLRHFQKRRIWWPNWSEKSQIREEKNISICKVRFLLKIVGLGMSLQLLVKLTQSTPKYATGKGSISLL